MSHLIEWLIFRLPSQWYDEAGDTGWISWGGGPLCLGVTYWPVEYATINILGLRKSWWAG